MNFQQLRIIRETVRHGFNLTHVASALHTSQPGISRHIKELESELGMTLFVRAGKRLTGLTVPGQRLLPHIERILAEQTNLRGALLDLAEERAGTLRIAATHSQARYVLPEVIRDFREQFPGVALGLRQGAPQQVAAMLISGEVDIAVATEALSEYEELLALPCYTWTHIAIVPAGHPLVGQPLTLPTLARYPLITYELGYTGRARIDEAFSRCGLAPSIALTAMDADVIKTYVRLGLGVGIIASMAHDAQDDRGLDAIDSGKLFGVNVTHLAVRRGTYLRGFAYEFIATFAPTLTRDTVERALAAREAGSHAGP